MILHLRCYSSIYDYIADEEFLEQELGEYGYEILGDLICGADYETTVHANATEFAKPATVNEALLNDFYTTNFRIIASVKELQEAMEYTLSQWRIFLHPEQRRLINKNVDGTMCVTGGAGTGKTVVAMHRAAELAKRLVNNNRPGTILFTTFSKALTFNTRINLQHLCTPAQYERIDVVNLDKWVANFLSDNGFSFQLDYQLSDSIWADIFDEAGANSTMPNDLSEREIKKEWNQIIQQYNILSVEEYLTLTDKKSDLSLTDEQKRKLWPLFDSYRVALEKHKLITKEDMYRLATDLIGANPQLIEHYVAYIVDEAQDLTPPAFILLAEMTKHCPSKRNSLFITGDGHQRIYSLYGVLAECGIEVTYRERLKLNYRTTEETSRLAAKLLSNCDIRDLNGGYDSLDGYTSVTNGQEPHIYQFNSIDEEIPAIVSYLESLKAKNIPLQNVCIALNRKELIHQYQKRLEAAGYQFQVLNNAQTTIIKDAPRIGTMHATKGLEFDYMILPGMSEENINRHPESKEETLRYRSLIHVAATRARKHVLITAPGPPIHWIN